MGSGLAVKYRSGVRGTSCSKLRRRPPRPDIRRGHHVWVRQPGRPWQFIGRSSYHAGAWDLALKHPVVAVDVLVLTEAIDPNVPAGASRARG